MDVLDDALPREDGGGVDALVRREEAAVKLGDDLREDGVELRAREQRRDQPVHRGDVLRHRLRARRRLGARAVGRRHQRGRERRHVRRQPFLVEDRDELVEELLLVLLEVDDR